MSVYSTQLHAGSVGAGTTTLYTVPPTMTVVVRDLEVYAATSSPIQFAVAVGKPGLVSYLWFVNPLGAGEWAQWSGRAVMDPGDVLLAVAAAAGVAVHASGYLLSP